MANTQTTILKSSTRGFFPTQLRYWLQELASASLFAHSLTPVSSLSLSQLSLFLLGAFGFPYSLREYGIKLYDALVDVHTGYSLGRNLTISWQLVDFRPCTFSQCCIVTLKVGGLMPEAMSLPVYIIVLLIIMSQSIIFY